MKKKLQQCHLWGKNMGISAKFGANKNNKLLFRGSSSQTRRYLMTTLAKAAFMSAVGSG